jgi:hypothetical protein
VRFSVVGPDDVTHSKNDSLTWEEPGSGDARDLTRGVREFVGADLGRQRRRLLLSWESSRRGVNSRGLPRGADPSAENDQCRDDKGERTASTHLPLQLRAGQRG